MKSFLRFKEGSHSSETKPSTSRQAAPALAPPPPPSLVSVSSFFSQVVSPMMWKKAAQKPPSPKVVFASEQNERTRNKSWATIDGIITGLTQYERICLNAMEERVLPPDVRIKIVMAQANVGDNEEKMEADVKRLDGLVRTLALYALLERSSMETSKKSADSLSPERLKELGKMLVAAVQLELFQMLDDICETGDVENELFDDLCSDTIQDGRRNSFVLIIPELLLSAGFVYKRLLQIRKDQIVEKIADVAGIRALAGHDCNKSPTNSEDSTRGGVEVDSNSGSPLGKSNPFFFENLRNHANENLAALSPSPGGHRRTHTERVQDLLSRVDGLVTDLAESSKEEMSVTALNDLPPLSPAELSWRPSGSGSGGGGGGGADTVSLRSGARSVRSHRSGRSGRSGVTNSSRLRTSLAGADELTTPQSRFQHLGSSRLGSDKSSAQQEHRAFFPDEAGEAHPCSDPFALAEGRFDPPALPAEASNTTRLLSEVDWLIAGTKAALGDEADGACANVGLTPGRRGESSSSDETTSERDDLEGDSVPEFDGSPEQQALESAEDGSDTFDDDPRPAAALEPEPVGTGGLVITPDKRDPDGATSTMYATAEGGDDAALPAAALLFGGKAAPQETVREVSEGDVGGASADDVEESERSEELASGVKGTSNGDAVGDRLSHVALHEEEATVLTEAEPAVDETLPAESSESPAEEEPSVAGADQQVSDGSGCDEPMMIAAVDSEDECYTGEFAADEMTTIAVQSETKALPEPIVEQSMADNVGDSVFVKNELAVDQQAFDDEPVVISARGPDNGQHDNADDTVPVDAQDVLESRVEASDELIFAHQAPHARADDAEVTSDGDATIASEMVDTPDEVERQPLGEDECERYDLNPTPPAETVVAPAPASALAVGLLHGTADSSATAVVEEDFIPVSTPAVADIAEPQQRVSELPAGIPSEKHERQQENFSNQDGGGNSGRESVEVQEGSEIAAVEEKNDEVSRTALAATAGVEFDDSETETNEDNGERKAVHAPAVSKGAVEFSSSKSVQRDVDDDDPMMSSEVEAGVNEAEEDRADGDEVVAEDRGGEVQETDTAITTKEDVEGEDGDSAFAVVEDISEPVGTVADGTGRATLADITRPHDEAEGTDEIPLPAVEDRKSSGTSTNFVEELSKVASLMSLEDDAASAIASSEDDPAEAREDGDNADDRESGATPDHVSLVATAELPSDAAAKPLDIWGKMSLTAHEDDDAASAVGSADANVDETVHRDDVLTTTPQLQSETKVSSMAHLDDDAASAGELDDGQDDPTVGDDDRCLVDDAFVVGEERETGQLSEETMEEQHGVVRSDSEETPAVLPQEQLATPFTALETQGKTPAVFVGPTEDEVLTPVTPISTVDDVSDQEPMTASHLPVVDDEPLDNGSVDVHGVEDSPEAAIAPMRTEEAEGISEVVDANLVFSRDDGVAMSKLSAATTNDQGGHVVESSVDVDSAQSAVATAAAARSAFADVEPSMAPTDRLSLSSIRRYSSGSRNSSRSEASDLKSTGFKSVNLVGGGSTKHLQREPESRALSATTGSYSSRGRGARTMRTPESLRATGFKSVNVVSGGSTKKFSQPREQEELPQSAPTASGSVPSYPPSSASSSSSVASSARSSSVRPKKKPVYLNATGFKSVSLAPSLVNPGQESFDREARGSRDRDRRGNEVSLGDVPASVVGRGTRPGEVAATNGRRIEKASSNGSGLLKGVGSPTRDASLGEAQVMSSSSAFDGSDLKGSGVDYLDSNSDNGERLDALARRTDNFVMTDVSLEDDVE